MCFGKSTKRTIESKGIGKFRDLNAITSENRDFEEIGERKRLFIFSKRGTLLVYDYLPTILDTYSDYCMCRVILLQLINWLLSIVNYLLKV